MTAAVQGLSGRIDRLARLRTEANAAFFAAEAERIAGCCHRMAERFVRGGRLVALGPLGRGALRRPPRRRGVRPPGDRRQARPAGARRSPPRAARSPPRSTRSSRPTTSRSPSAPSEADGAETIAALAAARARGALTIAFAEAGAEWEFSPETDDPFVRQELVETLYHLLWELVHVFFDHRGLLAGRERSTGHDAGASSFLYPFLDESETDLDAVTEDVRRSVLMKSAEVGELREQTLGENGEALARAAIDLRERLDAGGRLLACGNGGSATDAMDLVADLIDPPALPGRRGARST